MYKLLLVTDKPQVRTVFDSVEDWDKQGFRPPHVRTCAAEAEDCLQKHHADGIFLSVPAEDEQQLMLLLDSRYPLTPVVEAPDQRDELLRNLNELRWLLNRVRADYSNDRYDEAEMLRLVRHAYFRRVLQGQEKDPVRVRRCLRMMRSRMDPDKPCVLMHLTIPDEDGYLSGHWSYGADRLEVAMRNFFGAELEGMRILVSVLPDERIYLIACPMRGAETPDEDRMRELL